MNSWCSGRQAQGGAGLWTGFLASDVRSALEPLAKSNKRQFVVLQVQPTNSGLTTLLIPQTAVCDTSSPAYESKANLNGERGPWAHAVLQKLDLKYPQTAVCGVQFLSERRMYRPDLNKLQTAVWSIFAKALKLDLAIVIDRAIPSSLSSTSCNPLFSPNRSERSIV
jgi:hypothetical protein